MVVFITTTTTQIIMIMMIAINKSFLFQIFEINKKQKNNKKKNNSKTKQQSFSKIIKSSNKLNLLICWQTQWKQ